MFTGLVEDIGRIVAVERLGAGPTEARRLAIATRIADDAVELGASLAVDGTCLTVVEWTRGRVAAVAAAETLSRTTLGRLTTGARVNLEQALRVGDRLGGHMVSGHVDAVGEVAARATRGEALDVTVAAPPELLRYVVEKGSICVDGISLTVNQVDERGFTVSLVPHTQSATTLAEKPVGTAVNLEADLVGKYIEKLLAPRFTDGGAGGLTLDKLKENGFV